MEMVFKYVRLEILRYSKKFWVFWGMIDQEALWVNTTN